MTTSAETGMAKAKGRPKKSERDDKTVKIDRKIAGWAEAVAKAKGVSAAEYLSETLRAHVAKDFGRYMEKMKEGKEP